LSVLGALAKHCSNSKVHFFSAVGTCKRRLQTFRLQTLDARQNQNSKVASVNSFQWASILASLGTIGSDNTLEVALAEYRSHPDVVAYAGASGKDDEDTCAQISLRDSRCVCPTERCATFSLSSLQRCVPNDVRWFVGSCCVPLTDCVASRQPPSDWFRRRAASSNHCYSHCMVAVQFDQPQKIRT
jgi:hypothetical protein